MTSKAALQKTTESLSNTTEVVTITCPPVQKKGKNGWIRLKSHTSRRVLRHLSNFHQRAISRYYKVSQLCSVLSAPVLVNPRLFNLPPPVSS